MAKTEFRYAAVVEWTGNLGQGTDSYTSYQRAYDILVPGKPPIPGSSDPDFRGDPERTNPEELLVAAISSCHMLWFLHLCSEAGICVTAYRDHAQGSMRLGADGGGQFEEVVLRPDVRIAAGDDISKIEALHATAHERCFIANSVNFPIRIEVRANSA